LDYSPISSVQSFMALIFLKKHS